MRMNFADQPRRRAIVSSLLYLEAAIIQGLAIWMVVLAFTHEEKEIAPLVGVIIFATLGSAGLVIAGTSYVRGKFYGRAPAVLANLIALGVSYYQFQGGFYIGAIPLLILSVSVLYLAITITPEK